MTTDEILAAIASGEHDNDLVNIERACAQQRKKMQPWEALSAFTHWHEEVERLLDTNPSKEHKAARGIEINTNIKRVLQEYGHVELVVTCANMLREEVFVRLLDINPESARQATVTMAANDRSQPRE